MEKHTVRCATKQGQARISGLYAVLSRDSTASSWAAPGYAAHARANARVCSLGKDPDVSSSRVCLPPSSLTNESSQYVCGAFVNAILTVSCSRKSLIDN